MRVLSAAALIYCLISAQPGATQYVEEPVYPSPDSTGRGEWHAAFSKAKAFVNKLTMNEKIFMVTGVTGPCVGNIPEIPRLGFKGLCLQDGPLAIKQVSFSSNFPAGVAAAATWDKEMIRQRGVELGEEFFAKGAHVMLGPVSGPLGRSANDGRDWESFGADPYLSGAAIGETIEGLQSRGVQACPKHYIANEQETQRSPSTNADGVTIQAVSSNVDDRTMHEVYLWPFANSVKAGASALMCSYNRINESYACENSKTLNGLLKTELGFQGYVMSDWGGTHSGLHSILSGLDMDMPGPLGSEGSTSDMQSWFGNNITTMIHNGSLAMTRLDDMIHRIMTPYYFLQQDQSSYPTIDRDTEQITHGMTGDVFPTFQDPFNVGSKQDMNRDVRGNHSQLIREMGAAASVLLKNVKNTLPLRSPRNIGIFGNAAAALSGGPFYVDAPVGVMATGSNGGGTGSGRIEMLVSPLEAITRRNPDAFVQSVFDNEVIISQKLNGIYPAPDVCLVFLKKFSTEGEDRTSMLCDYNSTGVVETVTASGSCPNTVVIVNNPGPVLLPWADHENVTAIIAGHFPGEQIGNAIADVLFGDVNPSGKLPYTIAYKESDYNAPVVNFTGSDDPNAWQSNFTEGLMIDYRHFDQADIAPRYEFGFGLSYTTFSLSGLDVSVKGKKSSHGAYPSGYGSTTIPPPGGHAELWDTIASVSVKVKNKGSMAGAAVSQLYLSFPLTGELTSANTPKKVLRGFEKTFLDVGESATVTFDLMRRDVSYWDTTAQEWKIPSGSFGVQVGQSSRDKKFLEGELRIR